VSERDQARDGFTSRTALSCAHLFFSSVLGPRVSWRHLPAAPEIPTPPVSLLSCRNYARLDGGSTSVGTILAQSYVTMTGASLIGATISLSAAVTFTNSVVRRPSASTLALSGPGYTTPINLGTVASFAILAGSGITNTGPSFMVGNIGSYPTPMTPPQPAGAMCVSLELSACRVCAVLAAPLRAV